MAFRVLLKLLEVLMESSELGASLRQGMQEGFRLDVEARSLYSRTNLIFLCGQRKIIAHLRVSVNASKQLKGLA